MQMQKLLIFITRGKYMYLKMVGNYYKRYADNVSLWKGKRCADNVSLWKGDTGLIAAEQVEGDELGGEILVFDSRGSCTRTLCSLTLAPSA